MPVLAQLGPWIWSGSALKWGCALLNRCNGQLTTLHGSRVRRHILPPTPTPLFYHHRCASSLTEDDDSNFSGLHTSATIEKARTLSSKEYKAQEAPQASTLTVTNTQGLQTLPVLVGWVARMKFVTALSTVHIHFHVSLSGIQRNWKWPWRTRQSAADAL